MQVAPADKTTEILRALFGLGADDAVTWHLRQPAEREGGIGWVVACVIAPSGEEIRLDIRDSSPRRRSWISEAGLDLAYQGEEMRGAEQGPRERLLLGMGASFRAAMRRAGTELRAQFAQALRQAGVANGGQPDLAGRSSDGAAVSGLAQLPAVLLMALEDFDNDDGSRISEDGIAAVDPFLSGLVEAQTLAAAFELGLVDRLRESDRLSFDELRRRLDISARGLRLMTGLLVGAGVLEAHDESFTLTARFRQALGHRGLLLTLLGLIAPAAQDLIENAAAFFRDPWEFLPRAHAGGLFNYRETDPDRARVWVAALSQLTRYEAPACIRRHDFGRYQRILDVGGNSGELARQICARHPHVQATVFDLPVVCAVGARYLAGKPAAERVSFISGDLRTNPLPPDFDLVCFKSVLNDWGSEDVLLFLRKARAALRPGGRVLIYERAAPNLCAGRFPFRQLVVLPYLSNLRSVLEYSRLLSEVGFVEIEAEPVDLEMRFLLVTARRSAA